MLFCFFFEKSFRKIHLSITILNQFQHCIHMVDSICQQLIYFRIIKQIYMSIYSGFATRNQQQFYDRLLYNLISTLLLRISKFYRNQPVDDHVFLKLLLEQQRSLKKLQKRKYLEPKYSGLLTIFKHQVSDREQSEPYEKQAKEQKSKQKQMHQLNRTLSVLGRQFGELKANTQKLYKMEETQQDHEPNLQKILERKKNVSKKKKTKKTSVRSNLDIWDMRHEKTPELPSLNPMHPLNTLQKTIMNRTKFNNFSEKDTSRVEDNTNQQQTNSLGNILSKPPKFRSKMYFKDPK